MLRLGILIPLSRIGGGLSNQLPLRNQAGRKPNHLQTIQFAALGTAKMFINVGLTVTKLIPLVNRLQTSGEVTDAHVHLPIWPRHPAGPIRILTSQTPSPIKFN